MTSAAVQTGPACPKCGATMYDNRATKKSPKQPDFKCTRYKTGCDGVIWPPKAPKAAPAPVHYTANTPYDQLPEYLRDAEAQDAAELAGKIAPEKPKLTKLYLDATEFVLEKIIPKFEEKELGLSDTAVAAMIATVFIAASKER